MSVKIGHASIDENGRISDGKLGDQTGKEVCIRNWYSRPWNVYLECTDKWVANEAAKYMEQICMDDAFGYNQKARTTGYNSIVANGRKVKGARGDWDCSTLVSGCYIFAGLGIAIHNTTRTLRRSLLGTGKFVEYTDSSHLLTDKFAKRGGVYLSEGRHVVMALEDGGIVNPYLEPTRTIKLGDSGEDVKWVQYELFRAGFREVVVDGKCGPITDSAIRKYQEHNGLTIDGKVGPKTRNNMKITR